MRRTILVSLLASAALAQYTVESAGAPPADVPPAFAGLLQKEGAKVLAAGAVVCEVWFRQAVPSGPKVAEEGVTNAAIPHGAFMGLLRFSGKGGSDRRGQNIKPGLYTLRFSYYPINGDHQGVAPQRDFLVLTPLAEDKADPAGVAKFDDLMNLSRKASGTPHPAVLSMTRSGHDKFPDVVKEGEQDWVLHAKAGDFPVALMVVGKVD
ncbi:MAG: hypothetical protein HY013_13085 [Candidatus Solibacter usitatus]|nr:hypothetical protein [Candidatus Solibacter usitatus]